MTTITFDTQAYVKTLRQSGFSEQQSDALAEAHKNALSQMVAQSDLATRRDIAELEARLVRFILNALFGFAGFIVAAFAVTVAILK